MFSKTGIVFFVMCEKIIVQFLQDVKIGLIFCQLSNKFCRSLPVAQKV